MADIFLLPAEQTSAQSHDELRSVSTSSSSETKARVVNALESLMDKDATPQRTLQSSKELATAVAAQLKEQKLKPHEFKAVLNDVPAHARGALEDALKGVGVSATYLAPKENGSGFDVVNPVTDKAAKRPNPVELNANTEPVDFRVNSSTPLEGVKQAQVPIADVLEPYLGNQAGQARTVSDIRASVEQVATSAKEYFDLSGTPEGSRAIVIDAPAHLTGALEAALERKGIAAMHVNEKTGELARGTTNHSGAEHRGLLAVREAFGPEGKGVSDNQIRQAVGAERLQALGQEPKALTDQVIQQVLDSRPETITETNRRVNAVLAAAQTVELKADALAKQPTLSHDELPLQVVPAKSEIKSLEPDETVKKSAPAAVTTREREGPQVAPRQPSKSELGANMLRSYIVEATPNAMKAQTGIKLDGMKTFVGMQNTKVPTPTEKDISKHIEKSTLESFARDGVPHRELESLNTMLSARASQAGVSAPDRLDAVHLRQVAMNVKTDPSTQIRHEGKVLGTVAELRRELSHVNSMESKAREQLRGVLPEKSFDAAFKQLDSRTVQDIANNGVDRPLVEQLKNQMNQKAPDNPGWFKTADALNAISAAKSELPGKQLVSTGMVFEGKNDKYDGATVMLKVSDLRQQVEVAERALGRGPEAGLSAEAGPLAVADRKEPTLGPAPVAALEQSTQSKELARPSEAAHSDTRNAGDSTKPQESSNSLEKSESSPASSRDSGSEQDKDANNRSSESTAEQTSERAQERQERQEPEREATFDREMTR